MSALDKYKALFPLKVMVTQEMIDEGSIDLQDPNTCIGARALRAALGDNVSMLGDNTHMGIWGHSDGRHFLADKSHVVIDSFIGDKKSSMVSIKVPVEVEFRVG